MDTLEDDQQHHIHSSSLVMPFERKEVDRPPPPAGWLAESGSRAARSPRGFAHHFPIKTPKSTILNRQSFPEDTADWIDD
jgi:hypothetical protein